MAKAKFSPAYKRFCKLLVAARDSAGLTQVEVAKRLRKPQSYVSKIESGERRVDVAEFIDFAWAIDADPVELLQKTLERVRPVRCHE